MTVELDQALLSGDVEGIEALLGEMDLGDDQGILSGEETGSDSETGNEKGEGETGADQLEVIDTTKPAGDADLQKPEQAENPKGEGVREIDGQLYVLVSPENTQIASKDGKHTIPYAVLEKARNSASEASSKISELEGKLAQSTTTQQKLELYAKQLSDAGLTPDKLPEELLNDDDALSALQDELPETAANLLTALVKQFKEKTTPQEPQQQEPNNGADEVNSAFESDDLAPLREWEAGDADRWEMALVIDNKLKNDPQFQAMPLAQRFAEVQRRVQSAFGDPVQESIDKMKQEQQPPANSEQPAVDMKNHIPNSPSAIGGNSTDTTAAANQALMNQDAFALEQSLAGMAPEKVEEFLAQALVALD
ncbi:MULTISPECIES: hypothetical protein [Vibrio harveyi group]|uniref:hypothetical protein n=1 Tax=Vibrio harveyi group TaxID=717610 RepID=UPI0011103235|nr:hypothetical protein [Vibrio parahaemolyticus]MDG2761617.1 hypothetical protein [Vibrio parahaemolyticus]TMX40866.1 hypothetical protein DA098_03280 [Vibrio parahaemolyticus]TMX79829.1 hypothetical protein DA094_04920 [Vibrio parahaemolyticus]